MASGVRDFSVTFGSKVASTFISMLNQSCLAWFLEPSGRGSYAACLLFNMFLTLVFVLGVDVAAIYFVASKKMTLSECVTNLLILGGISTGLAVVAGLAVLQMPIGFVEKAAPSSFHLMLASLPLCFFSNTLTSLLMGVQEFTWLAILYLVTVTLQVLLTLVFVGAMGLGVNGALLSLIVCNLISLVACIAFYRVRYRLTLVMPSKRSLIDMLHYGIRFYFGKISNQVNSRVGELVMAFFATREQLGTFALAAALVSTVLMIPDTLTTVIQPRVAVDAEGRPALVAQCARVAAIVCGLLLAMLAVVARPVVALVFSPAFLPAVPLIRILAVGTLVMGSTKLFVPFLAGTNRPGTASTSVMIGTAVNILSVYLLMPHLGVSGAAWAMTLGYFAAAGFLLHSFMQVTDMKLRQVWAFQRSDWILPWRAVQNVWLRVAPAARGA